MTHTEWWWLFDAKRPVERVPGTNLTEDDLAELYELIS